MLEILLRMLDLILEVVAWIGIAIFCTVALVTGIILIQEFMED